ncbi:hypothetical protein DVR09_10845 [Erythrobacter aureus]|uniref:Uncharacterized protein n=1 Tax=Erythrobacter aureus TaxID=2182384 RepID=A0A345YFQ8_9SPHN|nr:hypothetical protein DVR09_10845 [Erythrobacter aureus]
MFAIEGQANPASFIKELGSKGYAVELIELELAQFNEYRNCDPINLPDNIRSKIESADLVIFYLSEAFLDDDGFEGLAQCAAGAGADILGVWPSGVGVQELPKTITDFGASVVSEDSAKLDSALSGEEDQWELPDQSPAESADKEHQKKC